MCFRFRPLFRSFIVIGVLSVMCKTVVAKDIVIHVENVNTGLPGNIMVMLYEIDGFPKNHAKAIAINVIPVTNKKVIARFAAVPAEFAIKILHDEDETGQVTKNWTGIMPAEGLGFSNGARIRFGPPKYEHAKLKLEGSHSPITIKMIYP